MTQKKPQAKNSVPIKKSSIPFYKDGLQFECQGSGKCCTSRGGYGYVYLTLKDRKRMAAHFELTLTEFTKQYCGKHNGHFMLKERSGHEGGGDCRFLKEKRCSVYEARPEQCRTWPFWPEVLNAKTWSQEVASFCPGVGKGKVHSYEEIKAVADSLKGWLKD